MRLRTAALALCLQAASAPTLLAGSQDLDESVHPARFGPKDVAVVVNDADPLSVRIGNYYARRRQIRNDAIVHVRFPPGLPNLTASEFSRVKRLVDARTPERVQAFVLTWVRPFKVDCMSITTAFAAGFDKSLCATGCRRTRSSPYFDSDSRRPYEDYGWRPTMALAGQHFEDVKALIDRGVAADGSRPRGTAYLLITSDKARNTRITTYPRTLDALARRFRVRIVAGDYLEGRGDVMFYFLGAVRVPKLETNRFLPGSIADHLTSAGGQLTGSAQMSSLRWLEAGATASYGTVVEPCAIPQKFPDPAVVTRRYLAGESLIEAYWKSVAWPGQGIFIGEPLAAPFARR